MVFAFDYGNMACSHHGNVACSHHGNMACVLGSGKVLALELA